MNFSQQYSPILAGEGLRLELINDHHTAETFALIQQNRSHLSEWLPWVTDMQTVENFQDYVKRCKQQHEEGTDYGFMIIKDDKIAGRIGIHYIQPQNKSGAIGYWLGKEFSGKGIITQSCAALIDFCFTELLLNRIEIKCGTGNTKSAAIPERLGFYKEGILRQAEWLNGGFIDLTLYSMLKEEWKVRL